MAEQKIGFPTVFDGLSLEQARAKMDEIVRNMFFRDWSMDEKDMEKIGTKRSYEWGE